MGDLAVPLIAAAIAVVAGWWSLHRPRTLRSTPTGEVDLRTVSVIIPARNEAHNLPTLLGSLASSSVRPDEVLVVDDSSTDDTATVAASFGATVLPARQPPPGWVGKTWACHVGSHAARGEVLLFLDADTELSEDAIAGLLAAESDAGGLLSVQPRHVVRRPYEQLSAVFNLVAVMGSGAFGVRPDVPARVAFGPCLATTADAYRHAGGHESVRDEVVEDIALAARYREAGRPVTCLLGGDQVRFRMYPDGVRSLLEGWTKNISLGATRAAARHVLPAIAWVCAVAAVWMSVLLGIGGGRSWWSLAALGTSWLIVTVQIRSMLHRLGTFSVAAAVLFVVPLTFFVGVFARSAVMTALGRPVRWRGRVVVAKAGRS